MNCSDTIVIGVPHSVATEVGWTRPVALQGGHVHLGPAHMNGCVIASIFPSWTLPKTTMASIT